MEKHTDLLFVINPVSGGKKDPRPDEEISGILKGTKLRWEMIYTEGDGDPERIRRALEKFQPSKVVAAGGDGTINMVAAQLINTQRTLGLLPSGSANGLAYNLNIPSDVNAALEKIIGGQEKTIDVLQINDSHFCLHLSDIGLNARVVKRFEKEGSNGFGGYAVQLMKELLHRQESIHFTIETQSGTKKKKVKMLVVANAKSYGTGAEINPNGAIDDGTFELVLIEPYPPWYMLHLMLASLRGKLHKMQHVEIISTEKSRITFTQPVDMHVDGEVLENIKTLKVGILAGALKVMV